MKNKLLLGKRYGSCLGLISITTGTNVCHPSQSFYYIVRINLIDKTIGETIASDVNSHCSGRRHGS